MAVTLGSKETKAVDYHRFKVILGYISKPGQSPVRVCLYIPATTRTLPPPRKKKGKVEGKLFCITLLDLLLFEGTEGIIYTMHKRIKTVL